MSIIHQIQGRDALLVWAIPFATGRGISPDSLANYLREYGSVNVLPPESTFPPAFNLNSSGSPTILKPSQWETLCGNLERLGRDLESRNLPEYEEWQEWEMVAAKLFPKAIYVWLDDFTEWLEKANELIFLEPVELCVNPLIPDEVRQHFGLAYLGFGGEASANHEAGRKPKAKENLPVPSLRLSQYLKLLELERHSHRHSSLVRLYHQLEGGLRILDSEGREAMYHGFELRRYSAKMPVLIDEGLPTLYGTDLVKPEELDRFWVRLEDVAGYLRANYPLKTHFYWIDENEKSLSLRVEDETREAFIGFLYAEAILKKRFGDPGHEITRGEIALWLDREIIRARNFAYTGAWAVDYFKWVQQMREEYAPEAPSLEHCLVPLYFSKDELESVEPRERWLSYAQLVERWKWLSVSESEVNAIIENHLYVYPLQIMNNYPIPLNEKENKNIWARHGNGPSMRDVRAYIPGAMYELSVIQDYEKKHLLPIHADSAEAQVVINDEAERPEALELETKTEVQPKIEIQSVEGETSARGTGYGTAVRSVERDITIWEVMGVFSAENAMESKTIGEVCNDFGIAVGNGYIAMQKPMDRATLEQHINNMAIPALRGEFKPEKGRIDPRQEQSGIRILAYFLYKNAMKGRTVEDFCFTAHQNFGVLLNEPKVLECFTKARALIKERF